jgi:undecaprenyl-diphosphatase
MSALPQRARAAVDRFDEWADARLERVRGNRVADRVFVTASALGDFSLVWHLVGTARGVTSARRANEAFRLAALLAVESLVVNQGLKRLFRRRRPTTSGDPRLAVRTPSTSSFPSGHASAAFFAADQLRAGDPALAPLWYGLAGTVAVSRPYVRIHHASDIVGGALVGAVLGVAARRLWPLGLPLPACRWRPRRARRR